MQLVPRQDHSIDRWKRSHRKPLIFLHRFRAGFAPLFQEREVTTAMRLERT
jgi:hypothetical protein